MSARSARSGFYGWYQLAALWIVLFINAAFPFFGAGVMNAAMARSVGLDKETLGLGFSLMMLCSGLSAPLVGQVIRRAGVRTALIVGAAMICLGAILMATTVSVGWQYILVFGIIVGCGYGLCGTLTVQSSVTLWFSRRRATAVALVLTASGVAGFTVPPIMNAVVGPDGDRWRTGWIIAACATALSAVVARLFVKNSPEEVGQTPDGVPPGTTARTDEPARRIHRTDRNWEVRSAVRTPAFWFCTFGSTCVSCAFLTYIAHGILHLQSFGHSSAVGAASLSLIALSSLLGRMGAGVLADRFEPRWVWAGSMLLASAGVFLISNPPDTLTIHVFAILLGLGYSGCMISWAATVANYFGPVSYPSIYGMQYFVVALVSAWAPAAVGTLYDRIGSYTMAFLTVATLLSVGAVLVSLAKPPRLQTSGADAHVVESQAAGQQASKSR